MDGKGMDKPCIMRMEARVIAPNTVSTRNEPTVNTGGQNLAFFGSCTTALHHQLWKGKAVKILQL